MTDQQLAEAWLAKQPRGKSIAEIGGMSRDGAHRWQLTWRWRPGSPSMIENLFSVASENKQSLAALERYLCLRAQLQATATLCRLESHLADARLALAEANKMVERSQRAQ